MSADTGAITEKESAYKKIISKLCLIILAVIVVFLATNSGAWLYYENNYDIDYTVVKLDFDLYSNQMHYYYSNDPNFTNPPNDPIPTLNNLVEAYENNPDHADVKTDFENNVAAVLKLLYPSGFVDEMRAASQSPATYNDAIIPIYQKYASFIEYPFKIRQIDLPEGDTYGILYYQACDILDLYSEEYVVQQDASGISTATVNMGVKLRGGTTYSANQSVSNGRFYDVNFNEMVKPLSMRFKNSGNVPLYLNIGMTLENLYTDSTANEKGILCMVIPFGEEFPTAGEGGIIDYRQYIATKLMTNSSVTALYFINNSDIQNLTYTQLCEVLQLWNTYAVGTYKSNSLTNENDNYLVENGSYLKIGNDEKDIKMLFWADYEQNSKYYYSQHNSLGAGNANDPTAHYSYPDTDIWATKLPYQLITYDFTINIKTSLKNVDLNNNFDSTAVYNKKEDYEKFAGVSNFDVDGFAYFLQNNGEKINAETYIHGGYIVCNYTQPDEPDYIEKLRFDVRYRGFSPAYIRVRVIEQWTNTLNEIVGINQIPFTFASGWVDRRSTDLYVYSTKQYFSTDKNALTTTGKAKVLEIPVITGFTLTDEQTIRDIDTILMDNSDYTLKMTFLVEAVQPNRFEEIWGIGQIPPPDTNTTTPQTP